MKYSFFGFGARAGIRIEASTRQGPRSRKPTDTMITQIQPTHTAAPAVPTGSQKIITDLLAQADIRINGSRPWDLRVHHPDFFKRLVAQGTLGLGESYMDGWWDCDQLDVAFSKAMCARLEKKLPFNWVLAFD